MFSNIAPSSMAKCEEGKSLPTVSKFSPQNCVAQKDRMDIRGHWSQNSGGGQLSCRSQMSRWKSRVSRRKANQPSLKYFVRVIVVIRKFDCL